MMFLVNGLNPILCSAATGAIRSLETSHRLGDERQGL